MFEMEGLKEVDAAAGRVRVIGKGGSGSGMMRATLLCAAAIIASECSGKGTGCMCSPSAAPVHTFGHPRYQTYKQQRRPIANARSFSTCLRRCACSARFEFNSTPASRSQVLHRHRHRQRHANERSARAHEHVVRAHRVQTNAHMHAHSNDLHSTPQRSALSQNSSRVQQ